MNIREFIIGEEAATGVEYAVMLALILLAIFGAIGSFGEETGGLWGGINDDLNATGFGAPH